MMKDLQLVLAILGNTLTESGISRLKEDEWGPVNDFWAHHLLVQSYGQACFEAAKQRWRLA